MRREDEILAICCYQGRVGSILNAIGEEASRRVYGMRGDDGCGPLRAQS